MLTGSKFLVDFNSGFMIDSRNRYSLSRLQMTAWTVLAIPALFVALGNNALRAGLTDGAPPLVIDWTLVALMGVSLASAITTPLVLSVKEAAPVDEEQARRGRERIADRQGLDTFKVCSKGDLITKADRADARISDLITGEEVGNAGTVDLTRIQMLAISLIVWIVYAVMLVRRIAATGGSHWIIPEFPQFDTTLLALLAVSHAGYLGGKVTPKTGSPDTASRDLARTTSLATKSDSLSTQIRATIDARVSVASGFSQLAALDRQVADMRRRVDAVQDQLAKGSPTDGELDRLDGRLEALTALYRALVGQGFRPEADDEPDADLIVQVKAAVGSMNGQSFSLGDVWLQTDQALLDQFIQSRGLEWADLSPQRDRAFDDILDLARAPNRP